MPSLDEYRARYDDLRSLSDADAIQQIAKVNGVDVGDVTSYLNYEPPGGDFLRQLKNSWTQTKQLGAGLGAAAAATAETSFGEGGLATGLKKAAVEKYKEIGNELQINSKASDSLSYSWEEAHKGNFGALVDWTQGAFGMGIGQIGQAIGTAGVGGIIGRTVGKKVVEGALSEMVEKEAKRLVLNNVAEDEAKKQAVGNVASRIGQNAAIGAQVLGMEGGEIGGDLAARATEEGRILTGAEIARALAATVVAAGPEAITERWALDAMTGKLPWLKAMEEASGVKGKTARAGMIGAAGATIGAGQEFTQTYIEEAGKGNEINNQTLRMAIDAAGMGAVGGAIPGAVGGLVTRPNEPAAQAPAEEAPPKPRGQVTLAEIEQMRTQRLAQLDQEERGHEGGVVTNPEGGIDVIAPRIGRELSPQEKGERLFLTTRPPEAIARRYGLEIAKPDDAEIAAPIIAAQDEDQAIAEFEKAATANVPAIESQKVDILGDAGREAEQALATPGIVVPDLAPVEAEQPAVAQAPVEQTLAETLTPESMPAVSLDTAPKTAMQIAFERAQQQSAARQPPADQAQATQPTASMGATVAAQQAVTAPQASIDAAPQALPEATQQAAPIEQRNPTRQERIAQMTPADIEQELYVSRATGIKNRRALDEDMQEGKKAVTFIDLDGLKYINDTFGHEKGNELLKKFADAMTAAGIDGYHISGDEFGKLSDNVVKAKRAIKALEAEASKARIESDTDILHGITFSYGIGKDLATADANMQKMKASREQAGLRVRGGRPPNLVARLAPPSQPAPQQAPTTPVQRGRRLQPFTDNRLSDPEARLTLQAMADAAGWAQVGGLLTRDSEGNVGRTKWIPRADWFGDIQADKGSKLTGNLKGLATRVAVRKALSGEPMTEAQKRHVTAMLEWKSQEQLDYEAQNTGSIDPFTLLMAAEDVGVDHGESLSDEALAARALEIDEEAANRAMAASEYESEFLDEMRRIVDGEANRQGEDRAVDGGGAQVQGFEASPASQEGFSLTGQTEAQRVAEEARKKAEKAAKDKADAEAEERARVDREAKSFELGAPTNQSDLQEQEIRQKADEAEARAKAEELGVAYPVRSRKESSDRWIEVQTGRKAPDEHQQKIMDAAQAARDAGITTLRETERFIDSRLPGYFPEGLGRGNGSSMASEVSFALRALDMLGASRREKDAASRLDLRPGQKVGDITINTGRKLRAAQVESIEDGEYVVVGTAGGKKYRTRLTADGLERAVQRASEEGSETDQPAQDDRFYYTTGLLGMTSSGSFTEDKSRWVTFPRDEAQSFDERNLKPAYATKRGIFTGVTTGRKLAPKPKPVTPQIREASRENEDEENERDFATLSNGKYPESGVRETNEAGSGQLSLFAAPTADKREAYADLYGTIIKPRTIAHLKASSNSVKAPEDVAHLLASIRKNAQEALYAVVADKRGKVLRVILHTRGLKDQSSVSPLTLIAEVASIPGAAQVHLAHNHPSGDPTPSRADIAITDKIRSLMGGTGISLGHHVVVAGQSWRNVDAPNQTATKIEPLARTVSVPVTERAITKQGSVGDRITTPGAAARVTAGHRDAVFLLNTQNDPVGIVPLTADEMKELRSGGRVNRLLSAINTTNASAAIIKTDDRSAAINVIKFLRQFDGGDIRVLDWIGPDGVSAANSNNIALSETGPFFSRERADENDLIIQHNLTAENLLHAARMGGLPVPSLAVTRASNPLDTFGEITLIGDRDLADPKRGTKVFGADIYSPRYPDIHYKIDASGQKILSAKLAPFNDMTGQQYFDLDELQRNGARYLADDARVMAAFLESKGIKVKTVRNKPTPLPAALKAFANDTRFAHEMAADPAFIEAAYKAHEDILVQANGEDYRSAAKQDIADLKSSGEARGVNYIAKRFSNDVFRYQREVREAGQVDRQATKNALRNAIEKNDLDPKLKTYADNLLASLNPTEHLFKGFTNSGNRSYIPHTLENVIKALKKEMVGGENFNYGVGSIRAKFTPQFRTIEQIRAAKGRLKSASEFESIKDDIDKEFFDIVENLAEHHPAGDLHISGSVLYMMKDAAKMGIPRALKENGFGEVPAEKQQLVAEFLTKLRNLPAAYFEAKVPRAVGLSEFRAAVVPKGIDPKARRVLERAGLTITEYKKGDGSRERAIAKASEGLMFSRRQKASSRTINVDGVDRPTQNSEGQPIHPTEEGIRNFWKWFSGSAAVDADGRPLVVYRGEGDGDDFDIFDKRKTRENSFFFTADENVARDYGNGNEPRAFYLKADRVLDLTKDSREAINFIREWAKAWNDEGWVDRASGEDIDPVDVVLSGRLFDYEGDWSSRRWLDLQASIQEAGYDGAVLPDTHVEPSESIIVFSEEQIKSATGNSGEFSRSDARIHKSAGEGRQGEHTVASVTSNIEAKLGKGALSKIADNFKIVPDMTALKADMEARGSKFVELVASKEGFLTKGLYDPSTDTSYIVAGNLGAEDSPYGIFLHEVGEHYGLEKMLGQEAYAGVLNQAQMILRAGGKAMREAAVRVNASENVGLDPDAKNFHRLFADKMAGNKRLSREVIAYLADNPKNHELPFMRRIMVAVREFMRKLGFTKPLTTDDIVSLITTAARRSGEFATRGGEASTETIKFGGAARPTTNSEGQPIHPTEEGLRNFWRWFGGSKVVDEEGRPLAVYHGTTSNIEAFQTPAYFSENNEEASAYTYWADLAWRAKRLSDSKYRIKQGADAHHGETVPYIGIISDIPREGRGKVWATDQGVVLVHENGRVDVYDDLVVGGYVGFESAKIVRGHGKKNAQALLRDWREFVDRKVAKGVGEGGNVVAVYLSIKNPKDMSALEGNRFALRIRNDPEAIQADIAALEAEGYDGIVTWSDEGALLQQGDVPRQWVAFRPEQIKSALGNQGSYDPSDPSILRSSGQRTAAQAIAQQTLFSRKNLDEAGSLVGSKFTLPAETFAQKAQRYAQDEANRFQVVQDAVVKQGGKVDESSNIADAIKRYPGRLAAAMKDTTETLVEPFAKRIHDAGTTTDEVSLLAYAEHAPERNAEIAKINPRFPNDGTPGKSGSGMTDQEAADIIKQVKAMPNAAEMFRLSQELRDITDQNLDNLVAGGEMEQSQADEYRKRYKFYVPLKGFELVDESGMTQPTGKGLSTGSRLGFRAMGRESRAGQIFEHVIQDYENGLMLSEKAVVAKTLRNFIKANPDDALWTIDNAPKKPRLEKGGSLYQIIAGGNLIAETASKDYADRQVQALLPTDPTAYVAEVKPSPKGLVKWRDSPFDPEEEIRFIENGKPVRIQLADAGMVRSYNRLWHAGVSDGLTLLNSYNGWLRQMYTQKNPAWFFMNAQKDVLSVMPYVTGEAGIKTALKIPGNIPGAFKAARAFHHGKTAGAKWNALIDQFKATGGYTGFAFVGDIEAQTTRLNGAIARHTGWDEALGKFRTKGAKAGISAIGAKVMNTAFFSWVEAMNSTFENMTRLAVFKSALDSGMTPNEAGKLAKNASTNFNTRGEWGPNINAVWLFANAGIQGTRNVGHALMFSPHKEQVWALMGGLVALGVMTGLMSDDDDDLLDDQIRSKSLVFKVGDTQLSLPMPYGFGFFSGFGQLAAQAMKHPEKRDNIALKMATLAFDHFSPVGDPLSGEADLKNVVNIAPTSIRPVLNVAANVSPFGGGPLFPESPYDETKPDSTKMWTATRGTGYDNTAKWLNALTGGDQYKAGAISVSPETLKLSVSTLFGGAGKLASDILSLPFDVANETLAPSKVPILKNYVREIDQKAYLGRFYQQAQEAQDAYTIWRRYLKAGMVDEATSYKQGEAAMISMGGLVSSYRKQIKALREMESMTVNSDLSSTEKNLRLAKTNAAIVQITTAFDERLKDFR